jgi:N6-L-threonylcarbamoyladenine synthase
MIILGIETSCDDTGIAIVKANPTKVGIKFDILSNIISSQIKTHAPFGGVVPNLAAREHLKNIEPCLKQAFKETNTRLDSRRVDARRVDLIAVTIDPGLIPSLLIGVNFAKALAYKHNIPIVGVNHLEGHILAGLFTNSLKFEARISNFESNSNFKNSKIQSKFKIQNSKFPAIALLVSGGHTQLILIKKLGKYKIVGETRDDAAGECFDKVAKLLRLPYPGGPAIAAQAAQIRSPKSLPAVAKRQLWQAGEIRNKFKIQNSKFKIILPRPMINQKNYDFSFSGLKTAVLYLLKDIKQKYPIFYDRRKSGIDIIPELCYETQQAIIDVLIDKTLRAAQEYKAKTIILSGGVAANTELREQFKFKIQNSKFKIKFLTPVKNLCMDNGAMIAMTGYLNRKKTCPAVAKRLYGIKADANLRLL